MQLLRHFVDESFINEIDPARLEPVRGEFISEEFLKRESDIVYKAGLKHGDIYIFVLLEFQTNRQKRFPIRILNYVTQFYDQYSRKYPNKTLPAVFPLLLYTGKKPWNIARNCSEMIENSIPSDFIPCMDYYPVLLNEIPEETLLSIHSTVSAMMYLEQAGNAEELHDHIKRIAVLLENENIINREYLSHWVNMLFRPGQEVDFSGDNRVYLKGGDTPMLAEMPKLLREEGRNEGRNEGKLEDKQSILIRQLNRKFALAEKKTEFIRTINDTDKLDLALDTILFAGSADEVFFILK